MTGMKVAQALERAKTERPLVSLCDARLELKLPVEDRFPTIWMPSIKQQDLRSLLRTDISG